MIISKKRLFYTFLLTVITYTQLLGQSNLAREIILGEQKREPIAHLLERISNKQNFSFAYNNKVIPADSLVSIPVYRGTLLSLLEKVLGENYEFKEVPGYVVLRYAPRKLFIIAEASKFEGSQTLIKGYVRDVHDERPVAQASVYEKNLLLSTLTDDLGYFELKLKDHTGATVITASKESYRDTSINLLQDVVVNNNRSAKKYRYYPDNAAGNDVEHSRFARIFISSKQLLQGLNVGNFFASSPYQVSLVPRLSTQGFYNSQVVDHVSLNIIGGYTAGLDGVELGGLFNINRKDMRFFQAASIFNFVGGNTRGVQIAGLYNRVLGTGTGFQFAVLGNNTNQFKGGFQFGILANKTDRFTGGLQLAALANMNQKSNGVQAAGLVNISVSSKGVGIAGLTNIARDSSTVQISGLMNKSGTVSLLQLGTLNFAKKVQGIQVGFMNMADSSDYPVGIINLIRKGEKNISLSIDQSFFTHIDFRSGGRVLYGLIGLGYQQDIYKEQYALNLGVGAHMINHEKFFLNGEFVASFFKSSGDKQLRIMSIKLLPGYGLGKHWSLFAGPAINLASTEQGFAPKTNGWIWNRSSNNGELKTLYGGLTGGIMYKF